MIDLKKVETLADWQQLRPEIERTVRDALGLTPRDRPDLQMKTVDEEEYEGYVRRRINYFVEDWERISAWLFIPEDKEESPAILCCHSMVGQGKDEPAGVEGNPLLAFAQHYAQMGYVTLAPDCITAGERVSVGLYPFDTKMYYRDNPRQSAMAKMLWDHVRAIDALCELKRVDNERIGVTGHGFGAQNALFLAALDERVQACVASCGFTRFEDDAAPERWAMQEGFTYIPKFRKAVREGRFPFDWEHVLALATPTPMLILAGLNGDQGNNPNSCKKAVKMTRRIYDLLGASEALAVRCRSKKQDLDLTTRETADSWFERWL